MNINNITVLKRDGRKKEFTIERIYDAIGKAYKEVYSELTEEQLDDVYDISRNVSNEIIALNQSEIDVETIQDIVVKKLLKLIKNIETKELLQEQILLIKILWNYYLDVVNIGKMKIQIKILR